MAARKSKKQIGPKQVVYLFGAGATQAEIDFHGARPVNLLMFDDAERGGEGISTRIFRSLGKKGESFAGGDKGADIEKLISLLSASGVAAHNDLAAKMRRQYFEEIREGLAAADIIEKPNLLIALFELHNRTQFSENVENLAGIITTNHDGLLQIASQTVYRGLNLGFPFWSEEFDPVNENPVPPIIQLHGSFTWTFGVPIKVSSLAADSTYTSNTIWIPPTILKESKNYPFNKLNGLAYELLAKQCDILRVVGASLKQNDWNVLSLIFNAQRHREQEEGAAFVIELIMPHRSGKEIERECSYLKNTIPIGHLSDGKFHDYKELEDSGEGIPKDSELSNQFSYWLRQKLQFHKTRQEIGDNQLAEALVKLAGEAP